MFQEFNRSGVRSSCIWVGTAWTGSQWRLSWITALLRSNLLRTIKRSMAFGLCQSRQICWRQPLSSHCIILYTKCIAGKQLTLKTKVNVTQYIIHYGAIWWRNIYIYKSRSMHFLRQFSPFPRYRRYQICYLKNLDQSHGVRRSHRRRSMVNMWLPIWLQ